MTKTVRENGHRFRDTRLLSATAQRDEWMARAVRAEEALAEWFAKTDWVRPTIQPHELGLHLADVLRLRIEAATKDKK